MASSGNDISIPDSAPTELLLEKHTDFIAAYGRSEDDFEYAMTEYLRVSGMYWGLTGLALCGALKRMPRAEVIEFVQSCQYECGGFGACPGHDPHLTYTLSAIQILVLFDALHEVDLESTVRWVCSLQQPDGSFWGDKWGEVDTRFSFCALASLCLLGKLSAVDQDKTVEFVLRCHNFDGGFGTRPGSESHSGQIYCCLGVLSIAGRLHEIDVDQLGWWLAERQLPSGGLNGRPEKLPDVCYSWWVLASLAIIGRLHWIDKAKLARYILACQDDETGGIADRPGDMVDPFHTLFGLAGLSLLGDDRIRPVNPVFCMPQQVIDKSWAKRHQLLTM